MHSKHNYTRARHSSSRTTAAKRKWRTRARIAASCQYSCRCYNLSCDPQFMHGNCCCFCQCDKLQHHLPVVVVGWSLKWPQKCQQPAARVGACACCQLLLLLGPGAALSVQAFATLLLFIYYNFLFSVYFIISILIN